MKTTASPAAQRAGVSGQHPLLKAEFAIVSSTAEFAALEEQWDELYDDCPRATPFQSWAWLYSW
ncbi:MAG: hypothetical protein L0G70_11000, partial [Rubrobacter sp.]|nr:hypothetical protein [Rubrobacter sp.]